MGTCWSITSFIPEIKKSIEESISDTDEKLCRKEFFSFALSALASLLAFLYNIRDLNLHQCSIKEKTEQMGLWSDP
jgi:hypothetical protein